MTVNRTPKNLNETLGNNSNDIAKMEGMSDGATLQNDIANDIKSKSPLIQKRGNNRALNMVNDLIYLTLKQEVYTPDAPSILKWVNMFDGEILDKGNAKSFIQPLPTGNSNYSTLFVPAGATDPRQESDVIEMYNPDTQVLVDKIGAKSYHFQKNLTIMKPSLSYYFTAGGLDTFVSSEISQMITSYDYFKYDKAYKMIAEATPQSVITDTTSATCFEVFSKVFELTNWITSQINNEYNYDPTSTLIQMVKKEDLVLLISNKTKTLLDTQLMTTLFNSANMNLNKYFNEENIIVTGKKLILGTENDIIKLSPTEFYLPENEIIILDKKHIKHMLQIKDNVSQFWANNNSMQYVNHIWGTIKILKWCTFIKYTATNMNVSPVS